MNVTTCIQWQSEHHAALEHKFGYSGHTIDFTSKSKEFSESHSQLSQFIPVPPGKFHTEDIVHGYCLTWIILMFISREKRHCMQ